ncbi:MAG: adenylosuccinate lyase [Bacteroidota bacterium]
MRTKELYQKLDYVDHSRSKRQRVASLVLEEPELMTPLLEIVFMVDDKISSKAAWVMEFACKENLDLILKHLEQFTQNVNKVHLDPAVRPVAKVCELLAMTYYSKKETKTKFALLPKYQERIVEVCFDWMINDEKIAPKAYAMNSLFLFGKDYDWIHPELKIILERDYQMQSSGFKARARHILKAIGESGLEK